MSRITSVGEPAGHRRREVLRLLRSSPAPMSILAIAEDLGVHPNTVRFHLDSLLGDGRVEQVEPGRKGPGRPPLMFQAVRQMDRGGTRHYRLLAEILTEALAADRDPRSKAMAAGRAWGRNVELAPEPSAPPTSAEDAID
ncbi:helix-turn-helix domain-containing protein, partial [Mycobacterium sp.]|uniref:helix-turn-helix domain-containing protein n=1 Tax=Mycobacterium sp. TaxID=1785 RepID=UPI002B84634F